MSNNVIDTFVLGNTNDIKSTNTMINLSRFTHWTCFASAIGGILTYGSLYLNNGHKWSDQSLPDRELMQMVANQNLWLFVTVMALIGGFIAWLNTDVLINRRMLLENRALAQKASFTPTAETTTPQEFKKAA